MNNIKLILFGIIAISSPAHSGIITDLNARFTNTAVECDNNRPAFYCSGVLIRGTAGTASEYYKPWGPSEHAINLGSTSFSYLRKDIKIDKLYRTHGYLLTSQNEAVATGLAIDYRCSYPYEADTLARGESGCTPSCESLGVTSINQWLDYMPTINSNIELMCSFDANDPYSYFTSIIAHNLGETYLEPELNLPEGGDYNEVLLKTWDMDQSLPIEAFWFLEGDVVAESKALNDREVYFFDRGINLPVVKIDLSNKDNPFIDSVAN